MKLAVPDLISNSYFPAVAAVELGFFAEEGLDVSLELIFPVDRCYEALRNGSVDFVAGSAHSVVSHFPNWAGVRLLCAQSQGMYWFLVMHKRFDPKRGALEVLRGRRIGAAPWVDLGLRRLLHAAGYAAESNDIVIAPVPKTEGITTNFGLAAAKALERQEIDGFWANGMAASVAEHSGVGTVVLDVRRGDGPQACFDYTFASIAVTEQLFRERRDACEAVVRAIVKAQKALRRNHRLAVAVGIKLFPKLEASLIAAIVQRDLPFYEASISAKSIDGMSRFAIDTEIANQPINYASLAAAEFRDLWIA